MRARVEQLRAGQRDEEQGYVAHEAGEMVDEVEQRRFRPVQVVPDENERLTPRDCFEEPSCRPEDVLWWCGAPGAEPIGDERRVGLVLEVDREVAGRVDDLCERPEGDPLAVGRAAAGEDGRARAELVGELRGEP